MMGHVNNVLLQMVETQLGPEGRNRLFEIAGLEPKRYSTEVFYPEEEFQALYGAAKELFDIDDPTAQETFAEFFMDILPKSFPAIFKVAGGARELLEKVPILHRQWPTEASLENFQEKLQLIESAPDHQVFKYDSPNRLCRLLVRCAELCLEHFGESGKVEETQCVHRGAPHCEVVVHFAADREREQAAAQ